VSGANRIGGRHVHHIHPQRSAKQNHIELAGLLQQVSRKVHATRRDLDTAQALLALIEQEQAQRAQNAPRPASSF
jgi:hypothetical protein